ncbi:Methyltransf_21 domain-containing protein/Methyltransf_11 domain-containing protein [Cephalotus follicularis]|uniref:Methyltransf_21 domain-containing protein/Methyltransf_11 domain-containing protein n=1 Tax=Cephalotus follicularis TaxID=3775 RepID=A0A1Q3C9X2_CEPFO|nr:Methyltransf_21 domain-containing protein/Methyltransf_11 domain-containing protein [Cephalotus follicularis]
MEQTTGKHSFLRNIMVKALLFGVLIIVARFAYVVTVTGESCNIGDFCFFSLPENFNFVIAGAGTGASAVAVRSTSVGRKDLYTSKGWIKAVRFYSSVFQDLISDGYLTPFSKSLCVETGAGQDVFALKEIGVEDSIGISKKSSKPLVIAGEGHRMPFDDNTFDFVFSGGARLDRSSKPLDFASEIVRTLKPEGFFTVHVRAKDTYSFNSFLDLFNSSCKFIKSRDIDGFDSLVPFIREIVMQKQSETREILGKSDGNSVNKCSVPGHKRELVGHAEPLIEEEPLKPWITLKKNIKNIKYLTSMADISFKRRYVYVDVGARGYGSSIVGWFKKQYPKQNKTFEIYAIEADKRFHQEYKSKKGVSLLPYAAWVRNETLYFEINGDPGKELLDKGRGMGRIKPMQSNSGDSDGEVERIQAFDFAEWLKNTVTEKDFVVMKMDVEGTEFDLIPRLFETGAICLIDEILLECHYNRWQRLVPGKRSTKYEKTYGQCLELFASLRESGVLVHQWW